MQADLCEFESSLVYKANPRHQGYTEKPCPEEKKKRRKIIANQNQNKQQKEKYDA